MAGLNQEEQIHTQYIVENWEQLAPLAWRGYLEQGRGCIVIEAADKSREGYLMVYYLSEQTLREREVWDLHPVSEPILEYDPNEEIVVLFRLPDMQQPVYKINIPDAPKPPEIYLEQQKGSETRH